MRINKGQVEALHRTLANDPKARRALQAWARSRGFRVPEPKPSGAEGADMVSDVLTEKDMSHVSRPAGLEKLHRRGITGKGVTVAVLDSGIAPHPDLKDQIVAFRDFTGKRTVKRNPMDPAGHGTHVSGIIAGRGEHVRGIAPESGLVGCRVGDERDAIKALDWIIENKEKYSIDVVNLSLGVEAPKNPAEDEFRKAAERAVRAGLVVVTAAGNECNGPVCSSTIASPGVSPQVITVGALDDRGTPDTADDGVFSTSSRGSEEGQKPDVIAEGVNVLAPLASDSNYARSLSQRADYVALMGSSQSAPMVSGAVALMLQVNPSLTHQEIKSILKGTADKVKDAPRSAQGSGRLDLDGVVAAAKRRLK